MNMDLRSSAMSLVNVFVVVVEAFLTVRVVLMLFGASHTNSFVMWVYNMTAVLLQPFRGIFPSHVVANRYVVDFTALFAMLMYLIAGLLLAAVVDWLASAGHAHARTAK